VLYCYVLFQGTINDDITLLSTSVFILGLAGLEYSIGILLLLIFKNVNKSIEFNEIDNGTNNVNIFKTNNIYINRYV
jgi:hypothetical protein